MSDDLLERATRELRDAYDGESKASDDTLERVLDTLETKKSAPGARVLAWRGPSKTRRTVLRTAAALAATLALTTAWAASTGRLGRMFELGAPETVDESTRERGTQASPPRTAAASATATASATAAEPPSEDDVASVLPTAAIPAEPEATSSPTDLRPTPLPTKPAPVVSSSADANEARTNGARTNDPSPANAQSPTPSAPVVDAPAPAAPVASTADPNDVAFEQAHRLHFDGHYADALVAWDTYLQNAPNGRFAPEARFNRAIALWKLGRKDEAKQALEPFARGVYGDYRRDEARRMLEAADR